MVPARYRGAIVAIYRFARAADDIADEGDRDVPTRLRALESYGKALDAIELGGTPTLLADLALVVRAHAGREFRAPQPDVPRGSWYFDATRKELVYVPVLDGHLERLADGSKQLRFRVRVDEPAESDSERKRMTGMRVEPVMPYTWFYSQ